MIRMVTQNNGNKDKPDAGDDENDATLAIMLMKTMITDSFTEKKKRVS